MKSENSLTDFIIESDRVMRHIRQGIIIILTCHQLQTEITGQVRPRTKLSITRIPHRTLVWLASESKLDKQASSIPSLALFS